MWTPASSRWPGRGRCRSWPRGWGHLWDALCRAYQLLGFDRAAGGDGVFRDLVLARIIGAAAGPGELLGRRVRDEESLGAHATLPGECSCT